MKIASFDIFDTSLIRKCGECSNVFYLLAHHLYPNSKIKAEAFYSWRLQAESMSRAKYPNLNDIYETYPQDVFEDFDKSLVMDQECEIEFKNLVGVPFVRSLIDRFRKDGWKILFISDMYLNSNFLKKLLEKEDLFKDGDELYVSAEYKATKFHGTLYDIIYKSYNPSEWIHHGDNKYSDVKVPSSKRIKTHHIQLGFNTIESHVLSLIKGSKKYNLASIVIGICRYLRVVSNIHLKNNDFSIDFLAPIYTSFILDVLDVSKREGFSRLYFLARDGWILYHLAQILNSSAIDVRYLAVSRKSLYLPSLEIGSYEEFSSYFGKKNVMTSKMLIDYFKLSGIFNVTENLDNNELRKKLEKVDVKSEILKKSTKEFELLSLYFEQEGLKQQNVNYAFVDIGWKGSGLYALNKLQKRLKIHKSPCFFWNTIKAYRNDFPIMYYTHNYNYDLPKYFINLVEDYFSANPELSTIGYIKNETGRIEPLFDVNSRLENDELAQNNLSVVSKFAECLVSFGLGDDISNVLKEIEDILVGLIIKRPYLIDVAAIKHADCNKNEINDKRKEFICKLRLVDVLKFSLGLKLNLLWDEASVCYTSPRLAKNILRMHDINRRLLLSIRDKVLKY